MSGEKILIIDDEQELAKRLALILQKADFQTALASDGDAGLRKAVEERPDLILLDVGMPGKDGFEVCQILNETAETHEIPVIFMTGRGMTRDKLKAFCSGAVDYIIKPFEPSETIARIKAQLKLQAMMRENLRLQEGLHQAQKLESLATLAGGVAHEFNNMICGIKGYAQLARGGSRAEMAEILEKIVRIADRASELVSRLVKFARPVDEERQPVDVNAVLREVVGFLEEQWKAEGIAVALELEENVPCIRAYRPLLGQVLLAILANARHAVQDVPEKRITVQSSLANGTIQIRISDTGCGLNDDELRRVFDPFFTTKGSLGGTVVDGKVHGTGLGLSVAYSTVKSWEGTLEARSTGEGGSTFTIRIPVEEPS
jgi:signal transduction histidine kinase